VSEPHHQSGQQPPYPQQSFGYPHYGPGGYPYSPPPVQPTMYPIAPTKSPGVAVLLAFLFGPLGMLYATVPGALIMMGVNFLLFLGGFVTMGLSWVLLFFTWIGAMVWAYVAADNHNKRCLPLRPPY